MGRGIAKKFKTTKKCMCSNPSWTENGIEVNEKTHEITYFLHCSNCAAIWKTKTHDARKFWSGKMDAKPIIWQGYSYNGNCTVKELYEQLDETRLEYLESMQRIADEKVIEAQKEAEKRKKEVEKFKRQIDEWNR